MADYKAMYLKLFNAAEDAIALLVKTQQECEELYCAALDEEEQQKEND